MPMRRSTRKRSKWTKEDEGEVRHPPPAEVEEAKDKDAQKEDETLHWETKSGKIMPFKVLHEMSKTVSQKGYRYVKCESCGKALKSMSIGSVWQHVDKKKCFPAGALEFWKDEHSKQKAEKEESQKGPMDDKTAMSEKRLQNLARAEAAKKPKEYLEAHYERFRYKPEEKDKKDEKSKEPEVEKKPEVKKIPKKPEEKEDDKEKSPSRAPIDLRSRSPTRKPRDEGRTGSVLAKSRREGTQGAKRVLAQAAREAPSPKPREHSHGGGVRSDSTGSNMDFLGNLSTEVDTIVWATVDSGAATSCLPKEMCQSLELAMKPVDEKPFTNASGQPVHVHGMCNPIVTIGNKGGPQVSGVGEFRAMDLAKPLLSVSKLVEHGKGIEGVSPVEENTDESIGIGDDEPTGSSSLPTAAAPTQREKEEHFVSVFAAQSIRRKSADDRYDVETLMSITGGPWDPQATKRDEIWLPQIGEGDQQPLAPPVPVEKPKKSTRRLYITKRDLDKYGYTAGCVACDAARIGKRSTGVQHTPACRERMERLLQSEKGNLRVAHHTAKVDAEITGQKQEVSEGGTKILYACMDIQVRDHKESLKVSRCLHALTSRQGEDVVNAPLIDDTDIVTELWYSATGESAPSLPTAGPSVSMQSPVTTQASAVPDAEGASASSASAKRTGGEQEEERSRKRLEMSRTKGQKRPNEPGGETSKAKDGRAASEQASKGTKRPSENERPDDIDTCLMNLIMEDRGNYLQSIEGEQEPVCEETIPFPPELEDEVPNWYYYDDISGKILDTKGVEKARRDEVEIIESFPVWEKIPRHKMPKGVRTIGTRWVDVNKQDEENPLYRSRLVAQEVKKGSGFDEFFAAMPSSSALKMLVTIAVTFQLPDAGIAVKEAYRYRPRMAQFFPHQSKLSPFVMWSDADHAGCVKTRKSVSGGVLVAGGCCIKSYSKGQGVVSLSSGESEYYALRSGASNLLGEVSTAKDWGLKPESEVFMDASAGIAMGSRRGLGKAKHVDTQYHCMGTRPCGQALLLTEEGVTRYVYSVAVLEAKAKAVTDRADQIKRAEQRLSDAKARLASLKGAEKGSEASSSEYTSE
eukprot:s2981_g3.t1